MLIPGLATYGKEAAMISTVEPGDRVMVVSSGSFGQVLVEMVKLCGGEPVVVDIPEGHGVEVDQVRRRLRAERDIKMVAIVHVETSTGAVHPVGPIGEMLQAEFPQLLYYVDAVSSVGGMEVRVDDWGIDLCIISPQKCINAPQGLALVTASEKAWEVVENLRTAPRAMCLDLHTWRRYGMEGGAARGGGAFEDKSFAGAKAQAEHPRDWKAHGPSPSYTLIKGLLASLQAILREGADSVFRRHRVAGRAVRAAAHAIGLTVMAASEEVAAPMATRIAWPEGFELPKLQRIVLEKYDVVVGNARIGTMGFVAAPAYVLPTIAALDQGLAEMGSDVSIGAGVAAANAVFAEGADPGAKGRPAEPTASPSLSRIAS